jgi:hypothetical protein
MLARTVDPAIEEAPMGVCEVCGNQYDAAMHVIAGGEAHVLGTWRHPRSS